jgi:hypothetical protein
MSWTLNQVLQLFPIVPRYLLNYAVCFVCRFAFVSRVGAISNCPAMLVNYAVFCL